MTDEQEQQLALAHGFTPISDESRGWGWSKFTKKSITVWFTGHRGWCSARLYKRRYINHAYFHKLEDALTHKQSPVW